MEVEMEMEMEMQVVGEYNDMHRSFLQFLISVGSVEKEKAITKLGVIWNKYNTEPREVDEVFLCEIVDTINERIEKYDQKIINSHYDMCKLDYLLYINISDASINQYQSSLTANEIKYFHYLLTEITQDKDHYLEPIYAINLSTDLANPPMDKFRLQNLLRKWSAVGYLYFDQKDSKIYIGPKGIAEYGVNLQLRYPSNIENCLICEDLIFYGLSCTNIRTNCNAIFHRRCVTERLKRFKNCPKCKGPWENEI